MSDPREEMRRILHRPPENKPKNDSIDNYDRADYAIDVVEHIYIDNKDDPFFLKCLGGLMKAADDALDAAAKCLDD